jgi:hypothetical protein
METTATTEATQVEVSQRVSIAYAVLLGIVAVLVLALEPGLLRFHPLSPVQLAEILMPLIVLSLFIERSVEVFVAAWRQGHQERLAINHERADSDDARYGVRHEISAYRDDTRFIALLASVCGGVAVATLGVRAVAPLVDADMLAALAHWQQLAFSLLDVLITGALIAGGADGLHKIVSAFTSFVEQSSRRIKQH